MPTKKKNNPRFISVYGMLASWCSFIDKAGWIRLHMTPLLRDKWVCEVLLQSIMVICLLSGCNKCIIFLFNSYNSSLRYTYYTITLAHTFNTQKYMQIFYISMGDKLNINNKVTFVFQKQYQKFIFVSPHK